MGRGKSAKSLALIDAAKTVLEEIQPASVRAVCYRLFTMNVIKNMSKAETNKVSSQLTWAREEGLVPWEWIVDETREAERIHSWKNPAAYVKAIRRSYRKDYWQDQPHWVEVWSEKGTIRGTLAPVLNEFGVTFRVMHGYGSATAIYDAAQATANRKLTVLYLGDWDPSGLHMSEVDLPVRLLEYGGWFRLRRLALNATDIADPALPSFDVLSKQGDPRFRWYADHYGARCWELDALNPNVLRARVKTTIESYLDMAKWEHAKVIEAAEITSIHDFLATWNGISGPASKYEGERP